MRFWFELIGFLFFRISSWMCSVPMWLTLILHFTSGLPIYWFWLTLAVWILAGVIRALLIVFARWGGNSETPERPNKNPYSVGNMLSPEGKMSAEQTKGGKRTLQKVAL